MSTDPRNLRIAVVAFLAIGAGIAFNVLALQDRKGVTMAERARLERSQAKAPADRQRRPVADPKDARTGPGQPRFQPALAVNLARPVVTAPEPSAPPSRTGRFATQPPKATAPQSPLDEEAETIRLVQSRLAGLGYEPGAANGIAGLLTRGAVMAFEHDQGLPVTGEVSEPLLRVLEKAPGAREAMALRVAQSRNPHVEQVLRTVQQSLASLGYFTARVDGRGSDTLERAIRDYEMDNGMIPTGRVSAPLLTRLGRAPSGVPRVSTR